VLNWDESEWTLLNMKEEETSYEDVCEARPPGLTLFPAAGANFTAAVGLCQRLVSSLAVIRAPEDMDRMFEVMANTERVQVKRESHNFLSSYFLFSKQSVRLMSFGGKIPEKRKKHLSLIFYGAQ